MRLFKIKSLIRSFILGLFIPLVKRHFRPEFLQSSRLFHSNSSKLCEQQVCWHAYFKPLTVIALLFFSNSRHLVEEHMLPALTVSLPPPTKISAIAGCIIACFDHLFFCALVENAAHHSPPNFISPNPISPDLVLSNLILPKLFCC